MRKARRITCAGDGGAAQVAEAPPEIQSTPLPLQGKTPKKGVMLHNYDPTTDGWTLADFQIGDVSAHMKTSKVRSPQPWPIKMLIITCVIGELEALWRSPDSEFKLCTRQADQ
jgi:hypothetical protein